MDLVSRKLVFPHPGQVRTERIEIPRIDGNMVLVESEFSLISNGTERTIFEGAFAKDSHWNRWVHYPFSPGYAVTGRVVATGSDVREPRIGDRVAIRSPHASHSWLPDSKCIVIPDDVSSEDAVWFALAKIAFWGLQAAGHKQGEGILIVGGGPIAQLLVRWAVVLGVGSIAILARDPLQLRTAVRGGAKIVLQGHSDDYSLDHILRSVEKRPDVIVDCTADAEVLPWALTVVADYGRVVLVGDPGAPNERRLTPDILLRGLSVVGIHDHNTYGEWNSRTSAGHFFAMLRENSISVEDICTHEMSPEHADSAYNLIRKKEGVLGVRFNW